MNDGQANETSMVRAMLCRDFSGPDGMSMGEVESMPPAQGEVRVAVRACGVNFPDLLMSRGQYQFKPEPPFSPGMEVAGEIVDVGEGVTGLHVGDRVIARTMSLYPGFAARVTLPSSLVIPLPDAVDDNSAAALYLTYYTAWNALIDKARLAAGEWVLVHGAAGGVGLAAVQIARAAGARVIAATGSPGKVAFLQSEGADAVVDTGREDLRDRVKEITGGQGVDVVVDPVGGAVFDASVRCLAPGGRLLVVGFTSGKIGTAASNIILIKEISVIGVRAGEYALRHPEKLQAAFAQLFAWFEEGRIAPRIARTYPLEQAADAVRALEDRAVLGKVVVTVD